MSTTFQSLGLILAVVIALVGTFVLLVLGHDVPSEVYSFDTLVLGAIAGATIPRKAA